MTAAALLIALIAAPLASASTIRGQPPSLPTPTAEEHAPVDTLLDGPLRRGAELVEAGQYAAAIALYDSLQQAFPWHPGPYATAAMAYQYWMIDLRLNDYEPELLRCAEQAIGTGTALMRTCSDPWLRVYVGGAYGFRALYRFRQHQWLKAWQDGRDSIHRLTEALVLDGRMYDCYAGLGSYHYWRTARSRFLSWLVFWMDDERQLGLQELQLAADHARYGNRDALHGLVLACFDAGDYGRAQVLNDQAMALADPPPTAAVYMRIRLAAQAGQWHVAEAACRQLLARLPPRSVGYQVECRYWLATALEALGRMGEARSVAAAAVAQARDRHADEEIEGALEGYDEVYGWLVERAARLGLPTALPQG